MKVLFFFLILFQTFLYAENNSLQKVKLQLQWKYQFQFAGFIAAKELGYYEDVGLDVELVEYNNQDSLLELSQKNVDYILTNSSIAYRGDSLEKATLIATYFQRSPLVIITHDNIKSILELKNKTIMISPEDHFNSSLTMLLKYYSIDNTNTAFVKPTYNIQDFIDNKVDATTAFRSNELFLLDKKNIKYKIVDPIEYGFPTNANNLFTSYDKIKNNPEEVKKFLNATKKGWEYALANTQEMAKLIHEKYKKSKSIEHLIFEGEVTKELMLTHLYEIGSINRAFVLHNYNRLLKDGVLKESQATDKLYLEKKDLDVWIKEQYIQRTEYTFAILITIFFIIIILVILYWSYKTRQEITKRVEAENALKHQSEHDSLTNLPNRYLMLDRLKQALNQASRLGTNIAVLYMDIDHFKSINDSMGHNVGDILLQRVSEKLQNSIRKTDTVSRIGSDEFVIILNGFNNIDAIVSVTETIIKNLALPFYIEKEQMYITQSIGISVFPDDSTDADTLIKNADAAMHMAKEKGRNRFEFFTLDMTDKAFKRVKLEAQLRQSIEKDELEVFYQPQIDASKNSVIGMEALVRWNHPTKGLIAPDQFIPLSEEIGFIVEIDRWVMQTALEQYKKWYDAGLNPGILSLNLSILRLDKDDFVDEVKQFLKKNNFEHNYFSFEITETQIMRNPEQSIKKLNELSDLGISFSIDDFGTGHSSLAYLKKLPISKLKIDRSFIRDIPEDNDDQEITKTIIAMAKNLHMETVAEGVETQEQKDFLLENECCTIQGYLYHKPAPAEEIEKILQEYKHG